MKKITGLVILLVVVLVLGGYYAMGLKTEHSLKSNLAVINKSSEFHVDIKNYQRGWFKSHAQLSWLLHLPAQVVNLPDNQIKTIPARDINLEMPLVIYHGPIIIARSAVKFGLGYAHTDLPIPNEFLKEFDKNFTSESTKPKPELSLFINYLNHLKVNFVLPTFKLIEKQTAGQTFEWLGMDSHIKLHGNKIDGDIQISGLHYRDGVHLNASIGKITTDYNLFRAENNLYLGELSTSIPILSIKAASKILFQMDGFNFYNKVDAKDNLLSYILNLSVDQLKRYDKVYGPGHLELAVRNLDSNIAAKINNYAIQMQQATDSEKQKISLAILGQLPALLGKGATFEVSKFDMRMPEGLVEGKALITLPKEPGMNPFVLIQRLKGNVELKMPVAVMKNLLTAFNLPVEKPEVVHQEEPATPGDAATTPLAADKPVSTDEQIQSMLQSGLIVQQDSDYRITLSFDKGQLLVNSRPYNPAMLKF